VSDEGVMHRKALSGRKNKHGLIGRVMTTLPKEAPANYVPAAAAIRKG
jgi:hypothetical protein